MSDDQVGAHPTGGPLMTKQSMAAETDINAIVSRHIAFEAPFFEDGSARYGDFTSSLSYHEAMNRVLEAQQQFDMLPAQIRDHCENDPGKFLELVMDPARRDELVKLGLVAEAIPPKPMQVEVVNPVPAAEAAAAGSTSK